MEVKEIKIGDKEEFNLVVGHPMQSFEWGEFRARTGIKVVRRGFFKGEKLEKGFTLTIHPVPHTPFNIGYLPKGDMPDGELLEELARIGKEEKCVFIQLEPNIVQSAKIKDQSLSQSSKFKIVKSTHPLFTRFTFVLDLTKSEDELLAGMHPKARYNIKVAKKHGVEVVEDDSDAAFEEYLRLTRETTMRQKFYAHTEEYHRILWESLYRSKVESRKSKDFEGLSAHLLTAKYQGKVLTAWILFVFKDTLYYPYGASSSEHREVMASNLMMWEAIRYGKNLGLRKFDMWGAMGPDPDKKDAWYGFHSFKEKYGPTHVEFVGSYDLVVNPVLYEVYKVADKLRWMYLRIQNSKFRI